jgi:pimeloyl-ACP methyl ester carboxylesterase
MDLQKKSITINGVAVNVTENQGAPLLLLVRMAASGMGLWDRLWEYLAPYYTVANFDLPTPVIDDAVTPEAMFHDYARRVVEIAQGLGHSKFHLFGWVGGARVALRCLVDYPEHLHSCVVYGLTDRPLDVRAARKNAEVINMILDSGNLELYTYNWLLSGFSPEYAMEHFDEIKTFVDARMEADRGRMDTRNVQRWIRTLGRLPVSEEELKKVTIPTLLVAGKESDVKHLHSLVKSSMVAIVPGGRQFVMVEDPRSFWAAVGPFMRSAARGTPPVNILVSEDGSNISRLASAQRVQAITTQPGQAIVFLHGWLMSPEMWQAPLSALSEKNRCLAVWQPGHGRTSAPEIPFTMDNWVEWLMEILDTQQIKNAVLVGHSMGGMLSLAAAVKHPDRIKGLVLVDTQDTAWSKEQVDQWRQTVTMIAGNWGPGLAPNIAGFLLGQKFITNNPGWIQKWVNEVAAYDLKGQIPLGNAIAERRDYSDKVHGIKVPTLVVHGGVDQAIHIDIGKAMASRIPGAEFVGIQGAAHCPPLESPCEFTDALVKFLEKRGLC